MTILNPPHTIDNPDDLLERCPCNWYPGTLSDGGSPELRAARAQRLRRWVVADYLQTHPWATLRELARQGR
jgi:hypothetical protein